MQITDAEMFKGMVEETKEDLGFAIRAARLMSQQAAKAGIEALEALRAGEDREDAKDRQIQLLQDDLTWQRREVERLEQVIRSLNQELDNRRGQEPCFKLHIDELPNDGIVAGMNLSPFKLQAGKIATIKAVRQLTGMGLKEAKDLVDNWEAMGSIEFYDRHSWKEPTRDYGDLLLCRFCGKHKDHIYHTVNDTAGDLPF